MSSGLPDRLRSTLIEISSRSRPDLLDLAKRVRRRSELSIVNRDDLQHLLADELSFYGINETSEPNPRGLIIGGSAGETVHYPK